MASQRHSGKARIERISACGSPLLRNSLRKDQTNVFSGQYMDQSGRIRKEQASWLSGSRNGPKGRDETFKHIKKHALAHSG